MKKRWVNVLLLVAMVAGFAALIASHQEKSDQYFGEELGRLVSSR